MKTKNLIMIMLVLVVALATISSVAAADVTTYPITTYPSISTYPVTASGYSLYIEPHWGPGRLLRYLVISFRGDGIS